jgi:hypothetical protein
MSFLSTLFRPAATIDHWPIIAAGISSAFQDVKTRWFNECVVAMDLGLSVDKQRSVDPRSLADIQAKAKVVHTDLGGSGALAITGYQICCAGSVIAMNGYLSKTSTKAFLDLLCGRVSGVETGELLKYIRRYDAANEPSTRRFKLGVDLARYVTNQEPSMLLSLHVASLAEKLFTLTCVVIANAFGDSARVHKLSRQITLLDSQLRPSLHL